MLERDQAEHMNYINYPTIEPQTCSYTAETSIKTVKTDTTSSQSSAQAIIAIHALSECKSSHTKTTCSD